MPDAIISREEALWTTISTPGLAVPVYAELVATRGRDSLQRAVLGLLRSGPMTAVALAADLGIAEPPLIEAVLRSLADDGAVLIVEQMHRLNEEGGRAESGTGVRGWMFWDGLQKRFVPRLFIDAGSRRFDHNFAYELERLKEWPERFAEPDAAALWRAVQRDDFSIQQIDQREGKRVIAPELDRVVKSISFSHERRRRFPLVVLVETRLRIAGEPAIFFHEPQVTEDDLPEPVYSPTLAGLLKNSYPEVFSEIRSEAQQLNASFLRENNAALMTKLGGLEKITAEADAVVNEQLRGISIRAKFKAYELNDTARQAEISRILWRHGLRSEAAARRDFAALIQSIARILGDEMGELLARQEFRHALDQIEMDLNKLPGNAARQRECTKRIDAKCRELGLHYRGWKLAEHLSKPQVLRSEIGNPSKRGQLGAAFVLWLTPPLLDISSEEGANHLRQMRAALRECPALLDIYDATAKQRHLDKASQNSEQQMPIENFATNTYRIWRSLGISE